MDFVAIDFETATLQHPRHICQIGLVFVKDGEIVDRIMRYVQHLKITLTNF